MLTVLFLVVPIFLFVIAGYLAGRFDYISRECSPKLVAFAMKVAVPCHIISALDTETIDRLMRFLNFFSASLLVTFVILLLSFCYAKYVQNMAPMEAASFSGSACMSNACMLALPIMALLMGHTGVIYGVLSLMVLVIMLQLSAMLADLIGPLKELPTAQRVRIAFVASLKQPFLLGSVIGLLLLLFHIHVPDVLQHTLSAFAATLAPLALFAVGLDLDFSIFSKKLSMIIGVSFFKLVLMPIGAWYLARLLHFSPQTTVALVICSAIASAKCFYGLSSQKGIHPEIAAAAVAGTTLLGMLTLPVIIYLLNTVYPHVFVG